MFTATERRTTRAPTDTGNAAAFKAHGSSGALRSRSRGEGTAPPAAAARRTERLPAYAKPARRRDRKRPPSLTCGIWNMTQTDSLWDRNRLADTDGRLCCQGRGAGGERAGGQSTAHSTGEEQGPLLSTGDYSQCPEISRLHNPREGGWGAWGWGRAAGASRHKALHTGPVKSRAPLPNTGDYIQCP